MFWLRGLSVTSETTENIKRKRNAIMLKRILTFGLTVTLAGCLQTMPDKPTRPTLVRSSDDSRLCYDMENAAKLGTYIIELERGYDR